MQVNQYQVITDLMIFLKSITPWQQCTLVVKVSIMLFIHILENNKKSQA